MTSQTSQRPATEVASPRVTFPRVVRAEAVKLLTVRSTWWVAVLALGALALTTLLLAFVADELGVADTGTLDGAMAGSFVVQGSVMAQIVLMVLGALVVTGEYSTGMIRTTFAAVPARWPVLVAKAIVTTALVAVVVLVGASVGALLAYPILSGSGVGLSLWSLEAAGPVLGAVAYLGGLALIALFLGFLLRSTAGTIGASLGLVLALPIIFGGILGHIAWARTVADLLPSVGERLLAPEAVAGSASAGHAGLVLTGWVVVLGVAAVLSLRSRDA